MTLEDIIQAIQHNIDEAAGTSEDASTFYTREQLISWINQSVKQAVNDLDPYELLELHNELSGGAAVSIITLPSDFLKPLELKIDGRQAKVIYPGQYWAGDDNPYSFADYYGVLFNENQMKIHPTTTTAYFLKYLAKPVEYTTATDTTVTTPPIPAVYHHALVHYATYLALRRDKEVAGDYLELYIAAIGKGASNEPK